VYDFGKKYSVLDFKFQELKQGAVYTAGFEVTPGQGSFIFKTTFYNVYGQEVSTSSVEVPEGTPIESVELDYENKELVIHTIGGDDIIADFSEMIDKIETLELEVETLNYEVAVGTSPIAPELARTWFQPTEVESSPFSLMGTPTVIEQEVTMGEGPEVNLFSASLDGGYGGVEQEVGTDDTEVNLLSASLDGGSSEQGVGFIEDEYIQSLDGIEPEIEQTPETLENEVSNSILDNNTEDNEQTPLVLEGDISSSTEDEEVEFIPGFSQNEIR
jgi:hypothetical protein